MQVLVLFLSAKIVLIYNSNKANEKITDTQVLNVISDTTGALASIGGVALIAGATAVAGAPLGASCYWTWYY